jgi:ATP-binding cassette subfamily B protein RaxB
MEQIEPPAWERSFKSRVSPIFQAQDGECGLACLAMMSSAFGTKTTLHELRSRFRTSSRGSTLHQLMSYAEKIGLASRAVRLEPYELKQLSLPAILHWDMCHYLVLEDISRDRAIVCDPARGRLKISLDQIKHRAISNSTCNTHLRKARLLR